VIVALCRDSNYTNCDVGQTIVNPPSVMQHLLDFIQEHTLEEQMYFVAQCPAGDLELQWRRAEAQDHWQIRPGRCEGPWKRIHRSDVIRELESRHADMVGVKQELTAMLAAQIAFADMVLRDAKQELGRDLVQRYVLAHQGFLTELQAAVEQLVVRPRASLVMVSGGGAQTSVRAGKLTLVR
jgi:hypothetical protein